MLAKEHTKRDANGAEYIYDIALFKIFFFLVSLKPYGFLKRYTEHGFFDSSNLMRFDR